MAGTIMAKTEVGAVHVTCPPSILGDLLDDSGDLDVDAMLGDVGAMPRSEVSALVDEWLTGLVDRWDEGSRDPHNKLHLLHDMPHTPGGMSLAEVFAEVRRRIR
jgi:hypothetical protein